MKVNSPARVGKLLLDSPVWRDRWSVSGGLQYLSDRLTLAGATVPPVYLVNLTADGRAACRATWSCTSGIRNLSTTAIGIPRAAVQAMDSLAARRAELFHAAVVGARTDRG